MSRGVERRPTTDRNLSISQGSAPRGVNGDVPVLQSDAEQLCGERPGDGGDLELIGVPGSEAAVVCLRSVQDEGGHLVLLVPQVLLQEESQVTVTGGLGRHPGPVPEGVGQETFHENEATAAVTTFRDVMGTCGPRRRR